jgi:type I site-specific restriction-modification system R (restriction) subunit
VAIADEAHRSQYDFIDGFAKHVRDALPKASFIGFHRHADGKRRQEHSGRASRSLHR